MVRNVSPLGAQAPSADVVDCQAEADRAIIDRLRERNTDKSADEVLADATAAGRP